MRPWERLRLDYQYQDYLDGKLDKSTLDSLNEMAVAFSLWIMNSLCMCVNRVHMYGICVHVYEGIATYICMYRGQKRMPD